MRGKPLTSNQNLPSSPSSEILSVKTGMAGFLFLAIQYVKLNSHILRQLQKKNLHIRLVLEAPDFYPAVRLTINGKNLKIDALSHDMCKEKANWDAKLIAPGEILLQYFMGDIGTLRPFLNFKIIPKNLIKLTQLIWFIKENQRFFAPNRAFARAVFWKLYYAR
jgi:hypothetical protein